MKKSQLILIMICSCLVSCIREKHVDLSNEAKALLLFEEEDTF